MIRMRVCAPCSRGARCSWSRPGPCGGRRVHAGLVRPRRPVLPERRKRRLRRRQLRPGARVRPRHRRARRQGRRHGEGDAGSVPVQSRPARLPDLEADRERRRRVVHARRPGARDHAGGRDPERLDVPRRGRLPRRPGGDHRSRPVDRGLDSHRRRRLRRQRAAGVARLVPVQRQPARQGDVRLRRHGARGPDRDGERDPRLVGDERRQDDLGLEGDRPDGDLPRDVDARQVRPDGDVDGERAAGVRRRRPAAREGAGALEAAGVGRVLLRRSTGRIRSTRSARSSTPRRTSATRSRRRRSRTSRTCRTRRHSSTRSRTCGSATR